jgi:hypothetical protein
MNIWPYSFFVCCCSCCRQTWCGVCWLFHDGRTTPLIVGQETSQLLILCGVKVRHSPMRCGTIGFILLIKWLIHPYEIPTGLYERKNPGEGQLGLNVTSHPSRSWSHPDIVDVPFHQPPSSCPYMCIRRTRIRYIDIRLRAVLTPIPPLLVSHHVRVFAG